MEQPILSYCDLSGTPYHGPYHDTEYGFPVRGDAVLFERLCLEINQAGLSWLTILRKREGFRLAYAGFDPDRVAAFDEADRARLLADPEIIRNRLKVDAAVENARRLVRLCGEYGSFSAWLDRHHPRALDEWVALFRKTFVFTGGQIVNEFLVSTGYLPGAHRPDCPVFAAIRELRPPWMQGEEGPGPHSPLQDGGR